MKRIISLLPKDALIIDMFMGSGTTGVAVLEMNKEQNCNTLLGNPNDSNSVAWLLKQLLKYGTIVIMYDCPTFIISLFLNFSRGEYIS